MYEPFVCAQLIYLDDLVAWKLQLWNVCGAASHQVAVENAKDTLVCDDKKVVVFALKLKDDGLQADGQIVVRLMFVSLSDDWANVRSQCTSALG